MSNNRERSIILGPTGQIAAVGLSHDDMVQKDILFGKIKITSNDLTFRCPGILTIPQENILTISAPFRGKVSSVAVSSGDYVKTGAIIASIENPEIVKLQYDYLDALNQFNYLKEEFKRQGELTIENATSLKKFQTARRDYQFAETNYLSLRYQLENLGIKTDSLKPEKLSGIIHIKSEGSGYINELNIHRGSFIEAGQKICEVFNLHQMNISVDVPENLCSLIEKGQKILYYTPFDSLNTFEAIFIRKELKTNPEIHSRKAEAKALTKEPFMLPGMSIVAVIKIHSDTSVFMNTKAVLQDSLSSFIFVFNDGYFKRLPVKPRKKWNDYIEISNIPSGTVLDSVVIEGKEYLNSLF